MKDVVLCSSDPLYRQMEIKDLKILLKNLWKWRIWIYFVIHYRSFRSFLDPLILHFRMPWILWVTKQFTWTGSLLLWLFCVLQTSWWFKLWPWTATNYVSCSSPYNTTNSRMSLPLILTFIPIISFHKVLSPLIKSAKIHAYHLSNVDFRVTEISGKYL